MFITTFDQAKIERDRILASPLLDIIQGVTISGRGNYDIVPVAGRTVLPIDERFVFELVLDFNDGGHQTLQTTEDVDCLLDMSIPDHAVQEVGATRELASAF